MSLRAKTAIFTAFVVVANVAGNAFINWGVKSSRHLILGVGVALLILWLLARMTLLSWADLSWVLPVTAIGYVLSAAAGLVFFGEHVTGLRWVGALLVAGGAGGKRHAAILGGTTQRRSAHA
jgi:uncharacterized membrane protein